MPRNMTEKIHKKQLIVKRNNSLLISNYQLLIVFLPDICLY